MPNQYTDNPVSRVRRVCETCGKPFDLVPSRIAEGGGRWCSRACYDATRRDLPLESYAETFWSRVDRSGGADSCWLWLGATNRMGYGNIRIHDKTHLASRIAWQLTNGPIPDGKEVCHDCPNGDNPLCVNPAHLWLGTHAENMADMAAKGRSGSKTHPERLSRGDQHYSRLHPERLARGDRHSSRVHPEKVVRGDQHYARREPERLARGEQSGKSALRNEDVLAIRERYATGRVTFTDLAREFGINRSTVARIVRRETWQHI